jgi:predicted PurR-regulated permease PerM
MSFGYWDYFMTNLALPVFALAFIAVPTFRLVMRLVEQFATGRSRVNWDAQSLVIFLVMLLVGGLIVVNLITSGGIHLITERPKAAVTVEGTLESVKANSVWSGVRYSANGESSSGYKYTVDGVTLTGMAKGTLEPGDEVVVTYLPKSGFVLSIEEQ